jgi:histidyl-tRNA synthetase
MSIRRSVRSVPAAATRIWPALHQVEACPASAFPSGLTRLFWQLREAGLIGKAVSSVEVLVTQMDAEQFPAYLALAAELRAADINTEVVMEASKLGKQFKYADRAGIRFVLVLGENELAKATVMLKDLRAEEQIEVARTDLLATLKSRMSQTGNSGARP